MRWALSALLIGLLAPMARPQLPPAALAPPGPAGRPGAAPAPAPTVDAPPGATGQTTLCCPEPAKRKITRVLYDCKCEDYCLPRCNCKCWLWWKQCLPCGELCVECGQPRVRHVLLKKIVTDECPTVNCVLKKCGDKPPEDAQQAPDVKKK